MTADEIRMVDSLRRKGAGCKSISNMLGISVNTIKTHCRRHPVHEPTKEADGWVSVRICKYCGKEVPQIRGRKEKLFCSDICRITWWNTHSDDVKRKAMYDYECQNCGKAFWAYGNRNRKYCCHECYIAARFG